MPSIPYTMKNVKPKLSKNSTIVYTYNSVNLYFFL